jgi:MFS family permease
MAQVMNSTIGSSLPSGASSYIAKDFHITDPQELVLLISVFLIGYILGPLFYGPISEEYGRKKPLVIGFIFFNIFTLACALATSFTSLLVFRLFNGMAAAAPIAITSGLFADIYHDPTKRGRTMAWFMAVSVHFPFILPYRLLTSTSSVPHLVRSSLRPSLDLSPL